MKRIILFLIILALAFPLVADQFTDEFYDYVNEVRARKDLTVLDISEPTEKVADTYSRIIAEEGEIDHSALSKFEFSRLCYNYGLKNIYMREILLSCPKECTPWDVFELFYESPDHRAAIIDPDGRFIGAGYSIKNGMMYFTAYVIIPKGD